MGYERGVTQPPLLCFADGTNFEVFDSYVFSKNGMDYLKVEMSPFDYVVTMLGLTNDDLNFDFYSFGVIVREYPKSYIVKISENPEKPVWWAFCTFDGVPVSPKSLAMAGIVDVIDENKQLQLRIDVLMKEVARLRKDNIALAMKSQEHFETMRGLTKSRDVLPMDMSGDVEIKRRVSSREEK